MKKSISFLLLMAGTVLLLTTAWTTKTTLKPSFNHLALSVYDLKRSGEFYEKVMNLQKIEEPFKDNKHIWFRLGEHSQLHLIAGGPKEQDHSRNNHVSLTVASVEEFIEHLKESSVPIPDENSKLPILRADGVKQVFFQDPDGFWIEVNNDRY